MNHRELPEPITSIDERPLSELVSESRRVQEVVKRLNSVLHEMTLRVLQRIKYIDPELLNRNRPECRGGGSDHTDEAGPSVG